MLGKQKLDSIWTRNLIVLLIVAGVVFRFYNIDTKVYWYDETMTSLRVSGHVEAEMVEEAYNGEIVPVKELLATYQYPNERHDWNETLDALAEHPEHSPLYYLMARFWLQLFGNSVVAIRSLSVLLSLPVLPCAYWLCWELFKSPLISWMGVAIIAISPFHVLFAQEAREYSLWTVAILLSSAALLRATRRDKWRDWGLYGVAAALGFYAHPFAGFVSAGHGIHVWVTEKFRLTRRVINYLLASLLGLLLFYPWLRVAIANFPKFLENTDSVNHDREELLPFLWGRNLSYIFFDFNQGTSPFSPLHYLSFLLAGFALYHLARKAPLHVSVFIFTLIGVTGIALIAPDLFVGGQRSTRARYLIPCYLGIQIALAYLVATKIDFTTTDRRSRTRWRYLAIALAFFGILSNLIHAHHAVWWHKSYSKSRHNPEIASIVNQAENPILVSGESPGRVLSLAHLLEPDTRVQLVVEPEVPEIPDTAEDVFFYRPSREMRDRLERRYPLTEPHDWLWKIGR